MQELYSLMEIYIFGVAHPGHQQAKLLAQKAHRDFKAYKALKVTLEKQDLLAE